VHLIRRELRHDGRHGMCLAVLREYQHVTDGHTERHLSTAYLQHRAVKTHLRTTISSGSLYNLAKWYKVELYLQWPINRKSYNVYRTAPFSVSNINMFLKVYSSQKMNYRSHNYTCRVVYIYASHFR